MGIRLHNKYAQAAWIVTTALLTLAFSEAAQARTETFRWRDPNPAPSPVVGFRLHLSAVSGSYSTFQEVGLPTPDAQGRYSAAVTVADGATVYAVVTAYNIGGVGSMHSNEAVRLPVGSGGTNPPNGAINSPVGTLQTIPVGGTVNLGGTATDPDGDANLSYRWNFATVNPAYQIPPRTVEDPGPVVFPNPGVYSITFTVTDSTGRADPTPPTVTVLAQATSQPPNGVIASPTGSLTVISAGQSVNFAGSGSDPDGDLNLVFGWTFVNWDTGVPPIPPSASEDPGPIVFLHPGVFNVTLAVTDSRGVTDPTPATKTIFVSFPPDPPGVDPFPTADGTNLDVTLVASGFDAPVYLTSPPGDPRLFVLEAAGRIRIIDGGVVLTAPFLDLSSDVADGPKGGLLGLAFDPGYAQNGRFFVHRIAANGDSVLSRFSVSSNRDIANPASQAVLLRLAQPFAGQAGGAIAFGPDDGFLYVGMGDGGSIDDPGNRAQDGQSLLGKLLRLDVAVPPAAGSIASGPYAIPASNPFVGDAAVRDEIWALGLRHPFRFSFDREQRDLWLADVGQDARQEINSAPEDDAGGNNYGWDVMQGSFCHVPNPAPAPTCDDASLVVPIHEYANSAEHCGVTGGYVYRGVDAELQGQYFFADFCSGEVFSLDAQNLDGWNWTDALGVAAGAPNQLVSFGEGADGAVYVLHLDGDIYRIGGVSVGCDEALDSDCDGIPNAGASADNCRYTANPDQQDSGGVGTGSAPDGIGNACQCGDVTGDGRVTDIDGSTIRNAFRSPPRATILLPEFCDVGSSAGCSKQDGVIIQDALRQPPRATISQVCGPANPPL